MAMKNRKTIIVAFMLIACMLIGVGYAVLTTDLYAKGSVILTSAAAEEEVDTDVYFVDAVGENCNANVDSMDSDIVIIRITDTNSTMALKGDYATVTATIQNDAGVDVVIVPTFRNGEAELEGISFSTDAQEYECAAGETVEVKIIATLTANVEEDLTIGSITDNKLFVTFTATAQAE